MIDIRQQQVFPPAAVRVSSGPKISKGMNISNIILQTNRWSCLMNCAFRMCHELVNDFAVFQADISRVLTLAFDFLNEPRCGFHLDAAKQWFWRFRRITKFNDMTD
jgi:hypothetical protein